MGYLPTVQDGSSPHFLDAKVVCNSPNGITTGERFPTDCLKNGSEGGSPVHYTVHGILQARILEWVSFSLLQGIFPTQGWNPGLPHCRLDSLPAEPPGGIPQGDPKQAEIQISPPYRLRSAPVVAMLRDPPQVNETFVLRGITALATPD